jgi:hypothetical protein
VGLTEHAKASAVRCRRDTLILIWHAHRLACRAPFETITPQREFKYPTRHVSCAEEPRSLVTSPPREPVSDKALPDKPRRRECAHHTPHFYCDACKADYDRHRDRERKYARARQRKRYKVRKQSQSLTKRAPICAACSKSFKGNRADARFCSATCRQRSHSHGSFDVFGKRRNSRDSRGCEMT